MIRLALILALALLAFPAWAGHHSPAPSGPPSISTKAGDWSIRYSPGMPSHPSVAGAGWSFNFPQNVPKSCPGASCGSVHYVTTSKVSGIALGQTLTATFTITTTGAPTWNHLTEKDGNTAGGLPSSVRMFFQRAHDNLSGSGKYQYYRWWSNPLSIPLTAGTFTLTVPLLASDWSSVLGQFGNSNANATAGFDNAIANLGNLGFTMGGGSYFGHGINVENGSATFTLLSYSVLP